MCNLGSWSRRTIREDWVLRYGSWEHSYYDGGGEYYGVEFQELTWDGGSAANPFNEAYVEKVDKNLRESMEAPARGAVLALNELRSIAHASPADKVRSVAESLGYTEEVVSKVLEATNENT